MTESKDLLKELRIDRSRNAHRSGRWGWLLALVPLLLIIAAGWWWLGSSKAATVRTVIVREATGSGASAVLNASGYVTARRQATVSSKTTGKIVEVLVEEGMRVRRGQVLARLDDSNQQASLALAKAELAAARQALAETRVRLADARRTLERTQGLLEARVASQAELDRARAEVDSLEARLTKQREDAGVAERQVSVWQQQVEDTVIRAPFSGVVVSKDAQPGEMISPVSAGGGFTRTGICTLVDMDSLEIEVDVNESYIARVEPGQRVEATPDAYPDWQIPAQVITTVPAADREKATVRVRIGFEKLDPRLLPDMGVKVTFLETGGEDPSAARARLLVPQSAVREGNGKQVVYVVSNEQVERRAVNLGATAGDEVVVLAGLSPGERVVVEGPEDLADGDPVRHQ